MEELMPEDASPMPDAQHVGLLGPVRVLALICLFLGLFPFLFLFLVFFEPDWGEGLYLLAISVLLSWPYLLVVWNMRRGRDQQAVIWAAAAAAAAFGTSLLALFQVYLDVPAWLWPKLHHFGSVMVVVMYCAASALLNVILGWRAWHLRRTLFPQAHRKSFLLAFVLSFLSFLIGLAASGITWFPVSHNRAFANDIRVRGHLHTLRDAAKAYYETYHNGFPPTLATLAVPAGGSQPNCQAADLIDNVLASGTTSGYVIEYRPGPEVENPSTGCPPGVRSYSVSARPLSHMVSGIRSYYADESGTLRATLDDRAATASDAPIGQ